MIPGPIPIDKSPCSPDDALLIGTPRYANAAAARAAGFAVPPNDPSRPVLDYVPSQQPFFTRDGATIESHTGGINLPNDDQTFPTWTGNGPTQATQTEPGGGFGPQLVDATTLCTLAEAAVAVAALNKSGLTASLIGDMSTPERAGGITYNWGIEQRRPYGLTVAGTSGSPVWAARVYALIASKANGAAGGIGAPGTFTLDPTEATCGLRFTPAPPNPVTLGPEVRQLDPLESLGEIPGRPFDGIMLYRNDVPLPGSQPAGGTDSALKSELDQVLAEEKKIEKGLGIE